MPGPTWYAKDIFGGTLKIPAGEMTAAMPLRWNSEPPTTGQVGGGPWVVSKHTKNVAAAIDFVKFVTTTAVKPNRRSAPGYPSYGPAANVWLAKLNKDPYFAAPPGAAMKAAAALVWKGWSMVTYPGPARLVDHRRHAARRGQVAELTSCRRSARVSRTTRRQPGTRS